LAPKLIKAQNCLEEEDEVTNPASKIYAKAGSPPFSQEIFEDVGRAVCVALLDHLGINPITRIPLSCYKTVENVRDDIKNNLAKYSNGQANIIGANHFSSANTRVSKQYSNGKSDNVILKKEAMKRASNSQSKDSASGVSNKQTARGTFGSAKRLTHNIERAERLKKNIKKLPPKR
jgi:hypothetical protein